jgi:hypothetical protein
MIKLNKKKLWKGQYISVRDYEVDKAIRAGGLLLTYDGNKMTIMPDKLKQLDPNEDIQKSKFGKDYQLVDIKWSPDNESE